MRFFIKWYFILQAVQVIPERAKVVYANKKFFHNYTFEVRRYSRKSGYQINIESTLKQQWTNNVSIHISFYEYLHNEYRRSFIEFNYKYCDLLKYEKYFAPALLKYGVTCPLPPGTYRFTNMTVPMENFPNVFPFEKARVDIENFAANETMLLLQLYASFKNTRN
ncbi:uncharacterized protein LOC124533357 [Vanessa cardui]|uniref:uncharacterized protein LOC124533357 n=1 Tax=Vanessa cardui TaxID=171605 RepID=UPI001F13B622|nr:uncharacterized protein LOC124533357 [Vanessa cardui]